MKKTFLFLTMLIGCVCLGQKKDTLPVTKENGLTITGFLNDSTSSYFIIGSGFGSSWGAATIKNGFGNDNYNKTDTVKVIMLVCDTVSYFYSGVFYLDKRAQAFNEGRGVWWQFGYMVYTNLQRVALLEPTYLDENKKAISKSLVVWMTKEIKQ